MNSRSCPPWYPLLIVAEIPDKDYALLMDEGIIYNRSAIMLYLKPGKEAAV
jgi:hypothetical protein